MSNPEEKILAELNEIAIRFGLNGADSLLAWSQTLSPDYRYSEEQDAYLYTDGDCGRMVIECTSEVFGDKGISIRLIDCSFCDISYGAMTGILSDLAVMAEEGSCEGSEERDQDQAGRKRGYAHQSEEEAVSCTETTLSNFLHANVTITKVDNGYIASIRDCTASHKTDIGQVALWMDELSEKIIYPSLLDVMTAAIAAYNERDEDFPLRELTL